MPAIIQTILVLTFLAAATYYVAADTDAPFWFAAAGAIVLLGVFWKS